MKLRSLLVGLALGGMALLGFACLHGSRQAAVAPVAVNLVPDAKEITWEDLVPANAAPPVFPELSLDEFGDVTDMKALQPIALAVNESLAGQDVMLPGFVVPLEYDQARRVREFLLVPYFGACMHLPPPPANQVVYATAEGGLDQESPYDPVWVTGRMEIDLKSSGFGQAAYAMAVTRIEPYVESP